MPSVAKGARRQAWKVSRSRLASSTGGLSGQVADSREELARHVEPVALGALAIAAAPLAREAHPGLSDHGGDERLDALEEDFPARERRRIDGDERLADARGPAFFGEEAVGLEAVGGTGERAHDELDRERQHRSLHAAERQTAA